MQSIINSGGRLDAKNILNTLQNNFISNRWDSALHITSYIGEIKGVWDDAVFPLKIKSDFESLTDGFKSFGEVLDIARNYLNQEHRFFMKKPDFMQKIIKKALKSVKKSL